MTPLQQSNLEVLNLSRADRLAIISLVRPNMYTITIQQMNSIVQYTFLNGYYFAQSGDKGLDKEFLQMSKDHFTIIGYGPMNETTRLKEFIKSGHIASNFFKKGMEFYTPAKV